MNTIIRLVISWLRRNPVQTGALLSVATGIADAIQSGEATWTSIALWGFALLTGGPAAIRSRWGTASQGGWFTTTPR